MTDIIDAEAGIAPDSELDRARRARPGARTSSQESYRALFEPDDERGFGRADRAAVAVFVAELTGIRLATYDALLVATDASLAGAVAIAARTAVASGPFGAYPPGRLSAEDTEGLRWTPSAEDALGFGTPLAAALAHAHLLVYRPREASPEALQALVDVGWDADGIISLSQLISFVIYQARVVLALRVLGGRSDAPEDDRARPWTAPGAGARPSPDPRHPDGFTQERLWWEPWIQPIPRDELTDAQKHGLVEPARAALPYFRLLARDPEILRARTLADLDIFTNADAGLPRAERELAAAAVSRVNGCVFCASVHARAASQFSRREGDVQRLLDEGIAAHIDLRWDAVIRAAAAIAVSPIAFDSTHVATLRAAGLGTLDIVDLASSAAFFSWANRLMLSLGEPVVPDDESAIREYEDGRRPAPVSA